MITSFEYQKKPTGFTLIELLVVIVLLGFLSITGVSMYQGSQQRGRDMRRKTDLAQIAKSLEMYANDWGYPDSKSVGVETGKIIGCSNGTICQWGSAWTRGSIYMQKLPKDPGNGTYCYQKDPSSGKWYKLYANLERTDDPDYNDSLTCAGTAYTYVLYSANITPTPAP